MIRGYRAEDLTEIAGWWDRGIEGYERPTRMWSDHVLHDARAHCLCCIRDGQIRGTGQCDIEEENAYVGIVVAPDFRRQGVATELASGLIDYARNRGSKVMAGFVEPHNEPSLALARSLSMKRTGSEEGLIRYEVRI